MSKIQTTKYSVLSSGKDRKYDILTSKDVLSEKELSEKHSIVA